MGELDNWKKGQQGMIALILGGIAAGVAAIIKSKKGNEEKQDPVAKIGKYTVYRDEEE